MTKQKSWFTFGMVVCILVIGALACVFPAEVAIKRGVIPSASGEGKAILHVKNAGCDCETSVVSGMIQYKDGRDPNMVYFTGNIEHTLNPGESVRARSAEQSEAVRVL